MSDSNEFPFPGIYRADCGHTHDFEKGSPVIACPDCGDGKGADYNARYTFGVLEGSCLRLATTGGV